MKKDGKVTAYAYNALNQITKAGDINYTWDNAGNLVSQTTKSGVLVASYTYDNQNRMISANVGTNAAPIIETYEYDYLGNRTAKTSNGVKTEYTTDISSGYSQVLKATTGNNAVYYTRGFELISEREGSTASYYLYDGGLSVRALTNEAGSITDTLVFDAFGNEITKSGTTSNSYGLKGEEKDSTGLYYLRARYMDPVTGTFTSMDTYGGSVSDPMSLHKYLYANSNPVMNTDPSGHFTLAEFDASAAIDSMLMSVCWDTIEWLVTDPDCQNKSFDEHMQEMGKHAFWAFFLGGYGGAISDALGVKPVFASVKDKIHISGKAITIDKLSRAEVKVFMTLFVVSFALLPLGLCLKEEAHNEEDPFVSGFLDGLADIILDPYYELLGKMLGVPPQVIPFYAEAFRTIAESGGNADN